MKRSTLVIVALVFLAAYGFNRANYYRTEVTNLQDRPTWRIVLHPRITDSAHKGDSLRLIWDGEHHGIVRWGWRGPEPVGLDTAWISIE